MPKTLDGAEYEPEDGSGEAGRLISNLETTLRITNAAEFSADLIARHEFRLPLDPKPDNFN